MSRILYTVIGEDFSFNEIITLEIRCKYFSNMKVSSIIRKKLHLSQKDYSRLIKDGRIKGIPEVDLNKCKLKNGIVLIFQADT